MEGFILILVVGVGIGIFWALHQRQEARNAERAYRQSLRKLQANPTRALGNCKPTQQALV